MADKKEKRKLFQFDAITVGALILIAVALALFVGARALESAGYMLRPVSMKYWFRFALIMGIIFLVAKFITNLPKKESSAKTAKRCAVVLCVVSAFLMFWQTNGYIDLEFSEVKEWKSEQNGQKYAIMEMKYESAVGQEGLGEVSVRFFRVYPKRNFLFYDCSRYFGDDCMPTMTVLDPGSLVKIREEGDSLLLYTEGGSEDFAMDEKWKAVFDELFNNNLTSDTLEYPL